MKGREMASLENRLKELDKLKSKGTITEDEYQTRRAAIMSDTAPPEQKRGGILRWGLIGCLGMFAAVGVVVVGIVVLIIVAVGSSSDLAGRDDVRVSFAEGSSGTVETAGDVKNRVTIDSIIDPAISDNQFSQPADGFHYLTIAMTIENAGERETTGGTFTLRTTDGFEYDQTFVSGIGASDLNFLQGLTSGGKTTAVVAFEVPDESRVEWLKFDPNPFAAGDLYFDNE